MKKVETFEDIRKAKRLFFEENIRGRRYGNFIEVKDIAEFIKIEEYLQKEDIKHNCSEKEYINYHNFHYE